MNAKLAAGICIAAAVVACIAVFLPWYSISMRGRTEMEMPSDMPGGFGSSMPSGMGMSVDQSGSANGTEGEFHGVAILILCLLGAAGAGLFAAELTELVPLSGQQILFVAALLFGVAALLCLIDLTSDTGGGGGTMAGVTISAGNDFGLYLAMLAVLSATTFAVVAAARAKGE